MAVNVILVFVNKPSVPLPIDATSRLTTELANSFLNIIRGSLFTCESKEDRTFLHAGLFLLIIVYCESPKEHICYEVLDGSVVLIKSYWVSDKEDFSQTSK